jgi:hypothetical protein
MLRKDFCDSVEYGVVDPKVLPFRGFFAHFDLTDLNQHP